MANNIGIMACPVCTGSLRLVENVHRVECLECTRSFAADRGIPLLFSPNQWDAREDVTEVVKAFYEVTPFPNYDDIDSEFTLREKAQRGIFARFLDEQIPHGARVLDVGCGTGQFSNFLGLRWGRTVFGTDICLNSLKLGDEFRRKNAVAYVAFVQMNLFRPVFKPETFDLVICNGVLHHTSDPFLGFQTISKLVKRGGHIIVGLYNRYGRLPTDLRRAIFKASGDRFKILDSRLRDKKLGEIRKETWFKDQYKHPHESTHTVDEVLRWFKASGLEFVNSIPKTRAFDTISANEHLFAKNPAGTRLDHLIMQGWIALSGGKEGGFFVMIARKPS